jgi:hypothetical protein
LICFYDSRNGLFSQGPEAIFLSLARQGGGSPLCPIRRAEAKTEEAPCGTPLKKCAATYFYKSIPIGMLFFFVSCGEKSLSLHRELNNINVSHEQDFYYIVFVLRCDRLGATTAPYHALDAGIPV